MKPTNQFPQQIMITSKIIQTNRLLVELEPGRSLLDIVEIKHEIEGLTKRKVDIVTERGIHWYLKDRILNEAVTL